MIFVKWFPDDILNGCSLLTWQSELVYYRLINYIYTSDNNLFGDDVTWQVLTSKFNGNYSAIKDELIKKKKIYIQDGKIKNKGGGPSMESPSVDRIIPNKGYVKGNVTWMSMRANYIKQDASSKELSLVASWLKKKGL